MPGGGINLGNLGSATASMRLLGVLGKRTGATGGKAGMFAGGVIPTNDASASCGSAPPLDPAIDPALTGAGAPGNIGGGKGATGGGATSKPIG